MKTLFIKAVIIGMGFAVGIMIVTGWAGMFKACTEHQGRIQKAPIYFQQPSKYWI